MTINKELTTLTGVEMTMKEGYFLTQCLLKRIKYMSEAKSSIKHFLMSYIA